MPACQGLALQHKFWGESVIPEGVLQTEVQNLFTVHRDVEPHFLCFLRRALKSFKKILLTDYLTVDYGPNGLETASLISGWLPQGPSASQVCLAM